MLVPENWLLIKKFKKLKSNAAQVSCNCGLTLQEKSHGPLAFGAQLCNRKSTFAAPLGNFPGGINPSEGS
jgi:hypothetical protein